jgi:pyruvate formate-lyase/glycerol dehydratase family glycyl radical enzyme
LVYGRGIGGIHMSDIIQQVRGELGCFTHENMKQEDSSLPLLKELLQRHYKARPAVDIERAYYMTRYYKSWVHKNKPEQLKRAESMYEYFSRRSVIFHDSNLLGGSSTSRELGAPLYPEFIGLTIWPELDLISTRKANPQVLTDEEARILNMEIFPFWMERTISERVRPLDPVRQEYLEKLIIYTISKAGTLSHTTPFYDMVLKKGLTAIIGEAKEKEVACKKDKEKRTFYRSVRIALKGILAYTKNIVKQAMKETASENDPARKKNLEEIARVCSRVPALPPRTFREAVNMLWLCQAAVLGENSNMAVNPGRLDQILYPYFIKDYNKGVLTIKQALEICGCLWFKLADNINLVPETAERLFGGAGAVPAITLGGVNADGEDAVNALTYVLLKVTELLPIRDPNVNARYMPDVNPHQYRDEVSRVILETKAIPAFYNDKENIATLVNQGIKTEHARDYAIIGCVELGAAGRQYSASSSIFMMLYTVLYMTLHNGKTPVTGEKQIGPLTGEPDQFKTFDDLWNAYASQLAWMVENAVSLNNTYGTMHQKYLPTPILSAFFDGPMEKGMDVIMGGAQYNSSGVTHIGFADVCDSLCAMYDVCFNEQNRDMHMSLPDFIRAVDSNFKGHGPLHSYVTNKAPKYGTNNPIARDMADRMIKINYNLFKNRENYRSGNYQLAYWTMTNHAGYGKISGAMPNGRKAGEPFSSGITPVSQVKTELTTALNSVARLKSEYIPNAYALNMKYSPVDVTGESITNFSNIIEGYMAGGGQQVQFNIYDYDTLIRAYNDPGAYPHLLVRVSGYSAYFRYLNKAMQRELIYRSQYNSNNKKLVTLSAPLTAPPSGAGPSSAPGKAPGITGGSIIDKNSFFHPVRNYFNEQLQRIRDAIVEHMSSHKMDGILELLLRAMSIFFFISGEYRKNIRGFKGTIVFVSEDGGIHATALFRRSRISPRHVLEVRNYAMDEYNVILRFKDGESMADFLLSSQPDILTGVLENKLSFSGNLNYLLRFVYIVRHIPVFLEIPDVVS